MSPQSHVAVASDQSLIAETVSAALAGPGLRVTRVPWPGASTLPLPRSGDHIDVGVMLCDLHPAARLCEALTRLRTAEIPWLVLTGAPPGPLWGAVLEAGAAAVHSSSARLDEVATMIDRMLRGNRLMDDGYVAELLRAWRVVEQNQRAAAHGVRSLSPRELAVLGRMHAGESVQRIAHELQVSESTVRSHVRSVLQKLDVKTQLAAVAEYEMAHALECSRTATAGIS